MSGLPNLGNTCYLNSILQCLRYLRTFVIELKDIQCAKENSMLPSFIELMFARCDIGWLRVFVQMLARENAEFELLKQCDAHEFFLCVVDTVFEEFKQLKNPFAGKFASILTCDVCSHTSNTSYPFVSISLELPLESKRLKLSELLTTFESVEKLSDTIDCSFCKTKQTMSKQIIVDTGPSILVIHLKRFTSHFQKNNSVILLENRLTVDNKTYSLKAICNHVGGLKSGHYTATCRKKDTSVVVCNDNDVRRIPTLPLMTSTPYIFFYEKINSKL
jgi:ubiquitin C-terminal hydrolase